MLRYFTFINLVLWHISINIANANNKAPVLWNVPNQNEYFIGRQEALSELNSQLKEGMLTIVGGAGIGKTQLAKKYAITHKNDYDIVWWFDSGKNIEEQFLNLVQEWNRINKNKEEKINIQLPSSEAIKQMKDHFRVTNLKWLLVFDNSYDKYVILEYIPENQYGYGRILATSKNSFSWNNIMKLEKFTRSESVELIVKVTNQTEQADELAELLGDYPLAIAQAASYIKSHPNITNEDYIKLWVWTSMKEINMLGYLNEQGFKRL